MTVWVDAARIPYGRMLMNHMIADDLEELHEMARKLGLKRSWFQDKPGRPHYDISWGKRERAIALGAKPVSSVDLVRIQKRLWSEGGEDADEL